MNEPASRPDRRRVARPVVGIALIAVAAAIIVVYGLYRSAHPASGAADSGTQIQRWLFNDSSNRVGRLTLLTNWMKTDTADPTLATLPYTALITDPKLETDRQQAIAALGIP